MKKVILFLATLLCSQIFAQNVIWEEVESDLSYFVDNLDFEDSWDYDFVDSDYLETENVEATIYNENLDLEFDEGDDSFVMDDFSFDDNYIDMEEIVLDEIWDEQDDTELILNDNIHQMRYRGANFNFAKVESGYMYEKNHFSEDKIFVKEFEICQTEVGQKLYMEILEMAPSYNIGRNYPVERVSWFDTLYFCNQLSITMGFTPCYSLNGETDPKKWKYDLHDGKKIDGTLKCDFSADGFRLPTEIEWEYAARGGKLNKNYKYSGSDDLNEVAWNEFNSFAVSHEIAQKKPNDLCIYDMSGNVWEWCWDSFENDGILQNVADLESSKVVKGGGFNHESYCSLDYREQAEPFARFNYVGFRICRSKIN